MWKWITWLEAVPCDPFQHAVQTTGRMLRAFLPFVTSKYLYLRLCVCTYMHICLCAEFVPVSTEEISVEMKMLLCIQISASKYVMFCKLIGVTNNCRGLRAPQHRYLCLICRARLQRRRQRRLWLYFSLLILRGRWVKTWTWNLNLNLIFAHPTAPMGFQENTAYCDHDKHSHSTSTCHGHGHGHCHGHGHGHGHGIFRYALLK